MGLGKIGIIISGFVGGFFLGGGRFGVGRGEWRVEGVSVGEVECLVLQVRFLALFLFRLGWDGGASIGYDEYAGWYGGGE